MHLCSPMHVCIWVGKEKQYRNEACVGLPSFLSWTCVILLLPIPPPLPGWVWVVSSTPGACPHTHLQNTACRKYAACSITHTFRISSSTPPYVRHHPHLYVNLSCKVRHHPHLHVNLSCKVPHTHTFRMSSSTPICRMSPQLDTLSTFSNRNRTARSCA